MKVYTLRNPKIFCTFTKIILDGKRTFEKKSYGKLATYAKFQGIEVPFFDCVSSLERFSFQLYSTASCY